MSIVNKSFNPLLYISQKANANLSSFRFIGFDGAYCEDGAKSLGVIDKAYTNGDFASVLTHGTAIVESSEAVTLGAALGSDSLGKAKLASEGDAINARALETNTAAGFIKVILV